MTTFFITLTDDSVIEAWGIRINKLGDIVINEYQVVCPTVVKAVLIAYKD